MATDLDPDGGDGGDSAQAAETKSGKAKPIKNLPTDRVSKETQFNILRAYAKASLDQGKAAVSNGDVARFAGISASSISTCNQFWIDSGLLVREGIKQRPVDAVFAYDQAVEWGSAQPGSKLAPVLASSWFGKALLAKLAIRSTTRNEALAFLAEECRATPDYKAQIELLLEYLETAALIVVDGTTVTKSGFRPDASPSMQAPSPGPSAVDQEVATKIVPTPDTKHFSIPIPGKSDAVIVLPENIDADDWAMVSDFLGRYVQHWKKFAKPSSTQLGPKGDTLTTSVNQGGTA